MSKVYEVTVTQTKREVIRVEAANKGLAVAKAKRASALDWLRFETEITTQAKELAQ
jgi:hypothetical protein